MCESGIFFVFLSSNFIVIRFSSFSRFSKFVGGGVGLVEVYG